MKPITTPTRLTSLALIALAGSHALAGERDIQFVNIITDDHIFMIGNLGTETIALDGWRFCTQNSSQIRVYSSPSGLDGVSIEPSRSITIHLDNNANPAIPTQHNASDVGLFADFELEAYALALYHHNPDGSIPFHDGTFMVDYLQWSIGGVDNDTADERADEAEDGGLWVDQSEWISVRNDTLLIGLTDPTGAELHNPANYVLFNNCRADMTDDGMLNFFDISAFLNAFSVMDPAADFDNNNSFNFFDVSAFLSLFAAGCP